MTDSLLSGPSLGFVSPVLAYLGPGGAVTAVGAVLAALAGILIAILGFVWYPIRRLLRKRRTSPKAGKEQTDA